MRVAVLALLILFSFGLSAQNSSLVTGSQSIFGVKVSDQPEQQKAAYFPHEFLIQTNVDSEPRMVLAQLNGSMGAEVFTLREKVSEPMRVWLAVAHPQTCPEGRVVDDETALDLLKSAPGISIAQRNHMVAEREVPDDPFFGSQWHHQNANDHDIDSELAWDITTGGTTATGDEIVICVVETNGANWALDDLAANHWLNTHEIPDNGVDDDDNGYIDDYDGWNVQSGDDNIPTGNHGSQVSSMAGAVGDNAMGVVGVNWDVKLMQVRMGSISEANVLAAYSYPLVMRKLYNQTDGERGAFVVVTNSSWGTDFGQASEAPIWCAMYDSLGTYGVLSCGATSNNNIDIDVAGDLPTSCPSNYLISVTATDINDIRDFSGYGTTHVDLGAPGDQVFIGNNSGYGTSSGTSFATPCVAGAVALLYAAPCPNLMVQAYEDPSGVASLMREYIFNGVDLVSNLSDEVATGGRLNVNNSLLLLLDECQTGDCIAPFSISAVQLPGTLDYFIVWGTTENMDTFTLRYRIAGETSWTEIAGIAVDMAFLTGLTACTEYEVQLMAQCENGGSDWSQSYFFTTDGCCVNPDANTYFVEYPGDGTVVIGWEAVTAAEGYTVAISINGIELEPQEAPTNSLTLTYEPCAEYVVSVFSICTGIEPTPSEFAFFTPGCGSCQDIAYCEISGDADLEHIARVILGDIDNVTASDGGYGDYTSLSTDLHAGSAYTMTLEPGYAGFSFNEQFKVWIDYDADGEFAQGTAEEIYVSASNITAALTFEFTVPLDVMPGTQTRMRVAMGYGGDSTPTNACGDLGYGEAEDYCIGFLPVSVAEETMPEIWVYPNPANDQVTFGSIPAGSVLTVFNAMGQRVHQSEERTDRAVLRTAQLATGLYTYQVSSAGRTTSGTFMVSR